MLRKSVPQDIDGVYRIICQLEEKELPYDNFASVYNQQVADERYYCLLWEEEGIIRGILNMRFEGQLHHASKIGEIMEFAISPEYRSRGMGSKMIQKAFDIAREMGCSQIEVATNNLRESAHRFYARAGMHNFHYKFSMPLVGEDFGENIIGR